MSPQAHKNLSSLTQRRIEEIQLHRFWKGDGSVHLSTEGIWTLELVGLEYPVQLLTTTTTHQVAGKKWRVCAFEAGYRDWSSPQKTQFQQVREWLARSQLLHARARTRREAVEVARAALAAHPLIVTVEPSRESDSQP